MQNSNTSLWVALVVVAIIAVGGWFTPQVKSILGAGTRFVNGLSADSTSPNAGQVRGTTFTSTGAMTSGGTLTVTTTNAATSTTAVGCIQTVATSTVTAIRFIIGSPNTAASSTASAAAVAGFVSWGYGSCPN